jgi:hypothetical protein
MMRRLLMIAMLALSFFAATQGSRAEDPIPTCHPCPWGEPGGRL